ncbi:cystathionine beta-synthase [Diaporthe eres]|nr:cystathionine beta-synthase [Diaporthe eres]
MAPPTTNNTQVNSGPYVSEWANRYRGAAVEDLQPPAALSLTPSDPISLALEAAFERDYTHLTIVDGQTRSLLGYVSIPNLQAQLDGGKVAAEDSISAAMTRFQRRGRKYSVITMDTPLEELEAFFEGAQTEGQKQEFAVITDDNRRFVLGVATRGDLEEFVKRRPA